jgi:hypothetical protein
MQEEESLCINRHEDVVFKFRDEAANDFRLLWVVFCKSLKNVDIAR